MFDCTWSGRCLSAEEDPRDHSCPDECIQYLSGWAQTSLQFVVGFSARYAERTVGGGALALGLDAAGGVRRIFLHGEDLPLSGSGGFSATEVARDPGVPRVAVYWNGFGLDAPAWLATAYAHAEQPLGAAAVAEDGNAFVRVGEGDRFGHDLAPTVPIPPGAADALRDQLARGDSRRGEQFPPSMLLALLIYCYATVWFSSRVIEDATHNDTSVPVREAYSWEHGICLMGATLEWFSVERS